MYQSQKTLHTLKTTNNMKANKKVMIYFRSLRWISKNMPKIISIGPPVTEKQSFKILKILSSLAHFISKMKKDHNLNFPPVKNLANIYLFRKFDIYWSIIVEITSHRTCYFDPLDIADNNLTTK